MHSLKGAMLCPNDNANLVNLACTWWHSAPNSTTTTLVKACKYHNVTSAIVDHNVKYLWWQLCSTMPTPPALPDLASLARPLLAWLKFWCGSGQTHNGCWLQHTAKGTFPPPSLHTHASTCQVGKISAVGPGPSAGYPVVLDTPLAKCDNTGSQPLGITTCSMDLVISRTPMAVHTG